MLFLIVYFNLCFYFSSSSLLIFSHQQNHFNFHHLINDLEVVGVTQLEVPHKLAHAGVPEMFQLSKNKQNQKVYFIIILT